jgi:hypothetical protein
MLGGCSQLANVLSKHSGREASDHIPESGKIVEELRGMDREDNISAS